MQDVDSTSNIGANLLYCDASLFVEGCSWPLTLAGDSKLAGQSRRAPALFARGDLVAPLKHKDYGWSI